MIRGDQRQQQLQQRQVQGTQFNAQSPQIYSVSSPDRQQPKVMNYASPPQIQSSQVSNTHNYQSYQFQTLQPNQTQSQQKTLTSILSPTNNQQSNQQLSDSYKYQGTKTKSVMNIDYKNDYDRKSNTSQKDMLFGVSQKENQNVYHAHTLTDIRNMSLIAPQEISKTQPTSNSNQPNTNSTVQVFNIQQLLTNNKNNQNQFTSTYEDKSKAYPQQSEMTKISSNLRDLLSNVQKYSKDGKLSDSLNEKILDLLTSFRKVEEQQNQPNNFGNNTTLLSDLATYQAKCSEYEKRLLAKEEDYQKLKGIMDSLQGKMTVLVQENQKINKNLIDFDNKVLQGQHVNNSLEGRNVKLEQEYLRVMKSLETLQRENEELRRQTIPNDSIKRQLFDDNNNRYKTQELEMEKNQILNQLLEKNKIIEHLNLQLQGRAEGSNKQEKSIEPIKTLKDISSSRAINFNSKFEQMELKVISLQIENENLTAEMAHLQIDNKAMDQKNEMISKLEDIIKTLLNDKSDLEQAKENVSQLCREQQLELQNQKQSFKELSSHYVEVREKADKIPIMDRKITYLEENIQNQDKNYGELERTLKEKLNQLKSQEKELLMVNAKINSLEDTLKKERFEAEKLKSIYSEDKNTLMTEYKKQIEKMDQHINEKNDVIERQQKEITKLKEENRKSQERNLSIERYVEQLNQSLLQQTALQQSLVYQIEGMKQNETTTKQEFERNESQMRGQLEQQSKENLQQQYDNKQKMSEVKDELFSLTKKLEIKQRELEGTNTKLQDQLSQISKLSDQIDFQKKVFGQSNDELQRRIKQEKQKNDETVQELKSFILNLESQKERLSRELNQQHQVQQDIVEKNEIFAHSMEQKNDQYEIVKGELDRTRSANFNLQEELLRAGMLLTQLQSSNQGLKNDVVAARNEQENLIELLKKRKDEVTMLHQNLEYVKKETIKSKDTDDSRKSLLKQQDATTEYCKRENQELKVILAHTRNDLSKKCKELDLKDQEIESLRQQYDQTFQSLLDNDRKWGQ